MDFVDKLAQAMDIAIAWAKEHPQVPKAAEGLSVLQSLIPVFETEPWYTMAVNVNEFKIGLPFIEEKTPAQLAFVILHEAMHVGCAHTYAIKLAVDYDNAPIDSFALTAAAEMQANVPLIEADPLILTGQSTIAIPPPGDFIRRQLEVAQILGIPVLSVTTYELAAMIEDYHKEDLCSKLRS